MSNPTRPVASTAVVQRRLRNLKGAKRRRLEDFGYPVERLAELAGRGDAEADRVDALLAIVLNRGGYTHDDGDVAAAEKIARKVGARMTPHAYLVARHKTPPWPVFYYNGGRPGTKPMSWLGVAGVFGFVFGMIVLVAVIVVLVR
ncbi:hypothetical protein [Kribbella sp. NPDC004536]|uniref:hypothetical protein n=1 Tax=Kribbella sp. NPDC004536 TaxID=3364106 RepID=UPI0036C8B839